MTSANKVSAKSLNCLFVKPKNKNNNFSKFVAW